MRTSEQGFTLIELLVVIAIIGILATIVLTSLGSARSKAQDAKVQAQLSSMRAQAELYYSSNSNSYGTSTTDCTTGMFGADSSLNGLHQLLQVPSGYTTACVSTGVAWAVEAYNSASTPTYWCVDSTGQSNTYSSFSGFTGASACPAM